MQKWQSNTLIQTQKSQCLTLSGVDADDCSCVFKDRHQKSSWYREKTSWEVKKHNTDTCCLNQHSGDGRCNFVGRVTTVHSAGQQEKCIIWAKNNFHLNEPFHLFLLSYKVLVFKNYCQVTCPVFSTLTWQVSSACWNKAGGSSCYRQHR